MPLTPQPPSSEICYHCGTPCTLETIASEDHVFCCNGCFTVFHLLSSNGLSGYYQFEDRSVTTPGKRGKYAWLDEPEASDALLDFANEKMAKVTFHLPAMHCAACIWLLEHLYRIQPGIMRSEVDFLGKKIVLEYSPALLNLRQVVELLDVLGYPPQLTFADSQKSGKKGNLDRQAWYDLGIAGFCFGNIMLLSFPEYLGIQDLRLSLMFSWMILGLSFPVLYAGRGYLANAWRGLRHRQINMDVPIALGIFVLFARSAWDVYHGNGHGYFDSLAGLVFFLLIGKAYQQKTYHLLSFDRDYKSYFPISIGRILKGKVEEVSIGKLQVGDQVQVRSGELLPADGVLVSGDAQLDYSFVTGESRPEKVEIGQKVYAGGRQQGGIIEVALTREVVKGYLPSLWNHPAFQKVSKTSVTDLSNDIARWFTPAVLLVAAAAGAYWYVVDPSQIWNVITSVLIVACPCALALSTPFALGHVLRIFGKRGLYLKSTSVVEELARIDHFVFDKTGTLTHPEKGGVSFSGDPLGLEETPQVTALLRASIHPLSLRLAQHLDSGGTGKATDVIEHPGQGLEGRVEGTFLRIGSPTWLLGVAPEKGTGSQVVIEIEGKVKGSFLLTQELRSGIRPLLQNLSTETGLSLVSGDLEATRSQVTAWIPKDTQLLLGQSPADKITAIQSLQAKGKRVAMVGDGLNDAGALQQSNLGIAVTDHLASFTPASDAILEGRSLPYLPGLIRLARSGMRMIYGSFFISLLYNSVGLAFAVTGDLSPLIAAILMPASSLSVILFNTLGIKLAAHRILPNHQAHS